MKDKEKMMRYIAERLGWEKVKSPLWHLAYGVGGFMVAIETPENPQAYEVILFAAYAKAAVAKHGVMIVYDGHTETGWIEAFKEPTCSMDPGEVTSLYEYEPTDPISEAWAIIRAIYELLGAERGENLYYDTIAEDPKDLCWKWEEMKDKTSPWRTDEPPKDGTVFLAQLAIVDTKPKVIWWNNKREVWESERSIYPEMIGIEHWMKIAEIPE